MLLTNFLYNQVFALIVDTFSQVILIFGSVGATIKIQIITKLKISAHY